MKFIAGWVVGFLCGIAVWLTVEELAYRTSPNKRRQLW